MSCLRVTFADDDTHFSGSNGARDQAGVSFGPRPFHHNGDFSFEPELFLLLFLLPYNTRSRPLARQCLVSVHAWGYWRGDIIRIEMWVDGLVIDCISPPIYDSALPRISGM